MRRIFWITIFTTMMAGSGGMAAVLEGPLEQQVFQRNAEDWAEVRVAGAAPAETGLVEAKASVGEGWRGRSVEWVTVATGAQIKDGKFSGVLKLETGGWYALTVRFRKSADDPAALEEVTVARVGVGDVFVTAGQSNSTNFGSERQKSSGTLAVYFDGKKFTQAADPMPDSTGNGGTPWPILGDMISRTTRAPVCFRSATVNWLRVREWVPGAGSKNLERLVERVKWFGPSGIRAVLWVQGEADTDGAASPSTTAEAYERDATAMIQSSREQLGWPVDWFVAGNSYIPPKGAEQWKPEAAAILSAQKALWDKGIARRGPDTNDLVGGREALNYRPDSIHFGPRGLLVHAERWFVALCAQYQWANPVSSAKK